MSQAFAMNRALLRRTLVQLFFCEHFCFQLLFRRCWCYRQQLFPFQTFYSSTRAKARKNIGNTKPETLYSAVAGISTALHYLARQKDYRLRTKN